MIPPPRKPFRWWEIYLTIFLSSWRLTVLALGSIVGIYLLLSFYILPATHALTTATPEKRQQIKLVSLLLMAVVLTMLVLGVIWAARRRR